MESNIKALKTEIIIQSKRFRIEGRISNSSTREKAMDKSLFDDPGE